MRTPMLLLAVAMLAVCFERMVTPPSDDVALAQNTGAVATPALNPRLGAPPPGGHLEGRAGSALGENTGGALGHRPGSGLDADGAGGAPALPGGRLGTVNGRRLGGPPGGAPASVPPAAGVVLPPAAGAAGSLPRAGAR